MTRAQADLMAIECIPAVLNNDIGVGLEQRDHLFLGRDLFPLQDTALGLADYPGGEFDVALQILLKAQGKKGLFGTEQGSCPDLVEESFPIAGRLPGDLEKIQVCPLSCLLVLSVLNLQHPSLGPAGVVRKWDVDALKPFTCPLQKSGDDTNSIVEQRGVCWGMDVGSDHCAVHTGFPTFLDTLVLGVCNHDAVDGFPGLSRDGLDIAAQGGLLETIVEIRDAAEFSVASRVDEMEGQGLIGESFELFYNSGPKHLFGGHSLSTGTFEYMPLDEILKYHVGDDRVVIEEPAHAFQELCVWVIHICGIERHLFLVLLAHFIMAPILVLSTDIDWLSLFSSTKRIKMSIIKCAF